MLQGPLQGCTVVGNSGQGAQWIGSPRSALVGVNFAIGSCRNTQIQHWIVGSSGTNASLNNAFFADNAQFTSGNLSPPSWSP